MEDLRRLPESDGRESPDTNEPKPHGEEDRILAALPVLRLITTRKSFSGGQADALDFVQTVILRLLGWRSRHEEKSDQMLREDWESFGARAAYNELKRHSAKRKQHEPLDAASEIISERGTVGETQTEVDSLARAAWQAICRITIRQRRALLLNSQDLIVYLLTSGIEETKLIEVLEISARQWREIGGLSLSDRQIAALDQEEKSATKQNENNVKKARFEARAKIKSIIAK